jgi:hypothetical protein
MAEVLRSQAELAAIRRSAEDSERVFEALLADGTLTVVDDEAPPDPLPLLDEEGEEVVDDDGNVVYEAPEPATATAGPIQIQVDAEDEAAEEAAAAAEEEEEE